MSFHCRVRHVTAEYEAFAIDQETGGVTSGVVAVVLVFPTLALHPQVAGQVGLELRPVRHRAVPQSCLRAEVWQRGVLEKGNLEWLTPEGMISDLVISWDRFVSPGLITWSLPCCV